MEMGADAVPMATNMRNRSSTKWFKKVDTNHFKFQGSSDEECCHPKYCSEPLGSEEHAKSGLR